MKPVTFVWNAVENDAQGAPLPLGTVVTYKLYHRKVGQAYTTPIVETTATTATVAMPEAGSYNATVTATVGEGDSGQSNMVTFNSVPLIPAAPTGLTVS